MKENKLIILPSAGGDYLKDPMVIPKDMCLSPLSVKHKDIDT